MYTCIYVDTYIYKNKYITKYFCLYVYRKVFSYLYINLYTYTILVFSISSTHLFTCVYLCICFNGRNIDMKRLLHNMN